MKDRVKAGRFAVAIAAVLILDQLTKIYINLTYSLGERTLLLGEFLKITKVFNEGFFLGLGSQLGSLNLLITTAIVAAMLWYYPRVERDHILPMGLIVGGALGNIIDRLAYGAVLDFIGFWNISVFNIADAAITIGCLWLLIVTWKK